MAKQKGIVKLEGTIGDVSFYKTSDGFLARDKGGVDKNRIKNDPSFQRTRENGQEFGRAGRAGKTLRTAFRVLLQAAADKRVTSRLTKAMMQVLQSDSINVRGERTVDAGNEALLIGFDFNVNSPLSTTLFAPYTVSIDRTGALNVAFPAFIPSHMIVGPSGATHVRIVSAGGAVHFGEDRFEIQVVKSEDISLGLQSIPAFELSSTISENNADSIYMVLGLEFIQIVNGEPYPLKSGGFNSLSIVAVDQAVADPEE